jgi:hypothetical protein
MQNELRIHSERLLDQTERQLEAVLKVTDRHKQETEFFNVIPDGFACLLLITLWMA